MTNGPLKEVPEYDETNPGFLYMIACSDPRPPFVKIGASSNLRNRFTDLQVGCPYRITHGFIISSDFIDEILGLENILKTLLKPNRYRGEWYQINHEFIKTLNEIFEWINEGSHEFNELEYLITILSMEALEIILHCHDFQFWQIQMPLSQKNPMENAIEIQIFEIADILSQSLG